MRETRGGAILTVKEGKAVYLAASPATARIPSPKRLTCVLAAALLLSPLAAASAQNAPASQPAAGQGQQSGAAASQKPASDTLTAALPRGERLYLKDGSYQIVREYHREGDTVRYYSLEQSSWEEIPTSLVDWDATQKAATEEKAQDEALARKLDAEAAAEAVANVDLNTDKSFEVRPGLILPDGAGLYAVDGSTIALVPQDQVQYHVDAGREIAKLMTGPMLSSKQYVDVPGKAAKLRILGSTPEFYFRPADGRMPDIALVRVDVKGDQRQIETMTTDVTGQVTYKNQQISLLFWQAAKGLYRYTVEQKLEPGEYALIETTDKGQATYVWDFGVNRGDKKDSEAKGDKAKGQ